MSLGLDLHPLRLGRGTRCGTLICPNSCPRWRSAQTCLCDSPRDAHSAIAPPNFFQNHEGATPDLVPLPRRSGCRSRFRLIDHERVSSQSIQLKAQPGWLCGELARMRSLTMGAENDHNGVRAAIRPSPSAIQRCLHVMLHMKHSRLVSYRRRITDP